MAQMAQMAQMAKMARPQLAPYKVHQWAVAPSLQSPGGAELLFSRVAKVLKLLNNKLP